MIQIIIAFGLTGVLVACTAAPSTVPPGLPRLDPAPGTSITQLTPFPNSTVVPAGEIVIRPQQSSGLINVLVGQTVKLIRPDDFDEWQVDYSSAVLTALTPPEKMRAPGLEGWRFRALTSGKTEIVITSVLPQCQKEAPCPNLNPERFVITLQVQ